MKTVSENDAWVLKPSNIKVAQDNDGNIFVSFPMKAYLSYTVKYYNNELPHEIAATIAKNSISDIKANNVTGQVSFDISNAGKYQIAVEASANNYETSEEVICADFVNVEKLDLDRDNSGKETKNCSVNYILDDYKFVDGANKTARVSFTPAAKLGEPVPTSWYKVYRYVNNEYETVEVTKDNPVIKTTEIANGTTYYVDDKNLDVTKNYLYVIAVTDGKKYGKAEWVWLNHKSQEEIETIKISSSSDNNKITWTVSAEGNAATATLTAKYLVVQEGERNKDVPVRAEDFKTDITLTLQTGATNTAKSYATETPAPTITGEKAKVYLLVTATKAGYEKTNIIQSVELNKLN